jgi:PRC-barrel domain
MIGSVRVDEFSAAVMAPANDHSTCPAAGTSHLTARFLAKRPCRALYLKAKETMMKGLMLGTAMALVLGSSVAAQDLFRSEMDPLAITASDFIGMRVYAAEAAVDADEYAGVQEGWNDIGEINDVILSRDGRVDAVLVDIGGFLGIGERQVALGMENIRFVSDSATADAANDYFLVINADRTMLEAAPEYMRPDTLGAEGSTGVDAAATDGTTTAPMTEETAAGDKATTAPATGDATTNDTGTAMNDGTTTGGGRMIDGYSAIDTAGITAEQLRGVRLYGPNDEDVGEISDIVLDDAGMPAQVIVDVGGFLGIGARPVAIEMSQLQMMQATEGGQMRAYVQMTQSELEQLPAVDM